MPELSAADVSTYTNGRLASGAPETQRMLNAALSSARRVTKWHVSPVKTAHQFTMDGPGSRVLWLPTMKVVSLTNVTENEVVVDPTRVALSVGEGPEVLRRTALRKRGGGFWSGEYGSISITMTHGFTEAEAADWRQGILSMVDQMSLVPVKAGSATSEFGQRSLRVDDVAIGFDPYATMAEEVLFSMTNVLSKYALPDMEFI